MIKSENGFDYSYILKVTEKDINSVMYDLATTYDRINKGVILQSNTLYSERSLADDKPIPDEILPFLIDIGFVDDCDHYLTDDGKKYFEILYVLQDKSLADSYIKAKLIINPVVNLIGQVFYGRGKISIEQLRILLNYHKIAECEIESKEITILLALLNRYGIVVYDKKNKLFYLKEQITNEQPLNQYYITPSTPFSNIYNMRKALRVCQGSIYWVDKHFRKEGFEIIVDGLAYDGVKTITIISGMDNVKQNAISDFSMLKEELHNRDIELNWRIINDSSFKWHDRWLVSDNCCYNIPPVLSILKGQRADIIKLDDKLEINPFMKTSISIDEATQQSV